MHVGQAARLSYDKYEDIEPNIHVIHLQAYSGHFFRRIGPKKRAGFFDSTPSMTYGFSNHPFPSQELA
jgi:hypothetical protein